MSFTESALEERERLKDRIAQLENKKKSDVALIDQEIRQLQNQLKAIKAYEDTIAEYA